MPHKYNAARRHHIPRPKRRVTNWAEYNEALRQRGSLTVWFTDAAIAAWKAVPRTTPGGQPHYSDLAITTALTLRAVGLETAGGEAIKPAVARQSKQVIQRQSAIHPMVEQCLAGKLVSSPKPPAAGARRARLYSSLPARHHNCRMQLTMDEAHQRQ